MTTHNGNQYLLSSPISYEKLSAWLILKNWWTNQRVIGWIDSLLLIRAFLTRISHAAFWRVGFMSEMKWSVHWEIFKGSTEHGRRDVTKGSIGGIVLRSEPLSRQVRTAVRAFILGDRKRAERFYHSQRERSSYFERFVFVKNENVLQSVTNNRCKYLRKKAARQRQTITGEDVHKSKEVKGL